MLFSANLLTSAEKITSKAGKITTKYTPLPNHHNRSTALFLGPPGWAGARRELLDFMVQGKTNRDRHTDHPAGRHSIRTKQCPPPPSPTFYRPDALPVAQTTVSKHWRQLAHSDQGEDARVLLNGVTCTVPIPSTIKYTINLNLLQRKITMHQEHKNTITQNKQKQLKNPGLVVTSGMETEWVYSQRKR